MHTKQDYLNGIVTHSDYYSQFVTPIVLDLVKVTIGLQYILNSTDPYFNNIPLTWFDRIHPIIKQYCYAAVKSCGDKYSLSTSMYIAKQAARILKEQG